MPAVHRITSRSGCRCRCCRLRYFTFDGEQMAAFHFVGRQRHCLGEWAYALCIIPHVNTGTCARHDRFFWVRRHGAAAGALGVRDDERLGARVRELEMPHRFCALVNLAIINSGSFEGHGWASCLLCL